MFTASNHAQIRAAQRCLPNGAIEYILEHGQVYHRAGAVFYFLRDCDIPTQDQGYEQIVRLAGTAVVVSKDQQTIITVWRNRRKGLKQIKRKSRYYSKNSVCLSI